MDGSNQPKIDTRIIAAPEIPQKSPPIKKRRRFLKLFWVILVLVTLGAIGVIAIKANLISGQIFVGGNKSLYSRITSIIQSQTGGSKLHGEKQGQVNILLLGIGGPGHDGPYLSDTIILAQIRTEDRKAILTSIPRDYLVNTKEIGQRKINAVFAEKYQQTKDWDKAGASIRDVVSKMSGLDIPYFAVIDFKGFEQTIDLLGGVDVVVDRTFTDYTFPDESLGYLPPVTFESGPQKMNGERALIFARSRHAAGDEGSDFARSQRQQKIIQAVKAKVVELNLIADVSKINKIFSVVGERFHTNLGPGELIRLYQLVKDYGSSEISSNNLDPATGILCDQTLEETGAYVLSLCAGRGPDDLKRFFNNSVKGANSDSGPITVWLADTTVSQELYKKAESKLTAAGMTVYKVVYGGKPLSQNVVYPVNEKPQALEYVKNSLNTSSVTLPPPGMKIDKSKVDLIILLGQ